MTEAQSEPRNTQVAPFPTELNSLLAGLTYRPGWDVYLADEDRGQGCTGLTVVITVGTINSYPPHRPMSVRHLFPVPPAAYSRDSWQRWLFECFLLVERHECMEWFTVDGAKPFAPNHGPGEDPYRITELSTDEARRTSWRGEVALDIALPPNALVNDRGEVVCDAVPVVNGEGDVVAHYADHHDGLATLRIPPTLPGDVYPQRRPSWPDPR